MMDERQTRSIIFITWFYSSSQNVHSDWTNDVIIYVYDETRMNATAGQECIPMGLE